MKRKLLFIACFLVAGFTGYNQEIKLKSGKVIIDKEERFLFKRRSRHEMIVRPLNAPDELLSIIWNNNGTYDSEDDFLQIVFPGNN